MKGTPQLLALALSLAPALSIAAEPAATPEQMHHDYMTSTSDMNAQMHQGVMSDDPDIAFAAGMLPHHEGAVKMAEIELKYGKDPEMRRLAEAIIAAQAHEISQMRAWLETHPDTQKTSGH